MLTVVAAVAAALCWGVSTLTAARSSQLIGAASTVAWITTAGLLLTLALLALFSGGGPLSSRSLLLLGVAGGGNVGGLLLEYQALRAAPVGLVAPIVSTEGALAALIAAAAGEHISAAIVVLLAVVATGIAMSASSPRPAHAETQAGAVVLALAAAVVFGVGMYAQGRVAGVVPLVWTILPARLVGTLLVAGPLAVSGRLTLRRSAIGLLLTSAACEVAGFGLFSAASRGQVGVAAVLSSQFAAFAALGAFVCFGERLTARQWIGMGLIAVGVASLTALLGR